MKNWFYFLGLLLLSCHQHPKQVATWTCLPGDIKLDEYVTRRNNRFITVEEELKTLNADCKHGQLIDGQGKEIRFFRSYCGGAAPPPDLLLRKRQELEELQKQYAVIVMECHVDGKGLPE